VGGEGGEVQREKWNILKSCKSYLQISDKANSVDWIDKIGSPSRVCYKVQSRAEI